MKIFLCTNKVIIYGKRKKCWNNVKTKFSDSETGPGKLKVEMKYLNNVRNKHYWKINNVNFR